MPKYKSVIKSAGQKCRCFTLDQYNKKVLFVGISVVATFFLPVAMLKFAHHALHLISKSPRVFLHPNQLADSESKFSFLAIKNTYAAIDFDP